MSSGMSQVGRVVSALGVLSFCFVLLFVVFCTGTVLASSGDDAVVRLWTKDPFSGGWQALSTIEPTPE